MNNVQNFFDIQSYTFNIHTLRHIGDQVRKFGTICFSNAGVFESWCGFLKKLNTGDSRSILNVIGRRYLVHKNRTLNTLKPRSSELVKVVGQLYTAKKRGI